MQIDDPERGFSYKADGPLDLRLNPEAGISAAERLKTIDGGGTGRDADRKLRRALCRGNCQNYYRSHPPGRKGRNHPSGSGS